MSFLPKRSAFEVARVVSLFRERSAFWTTQGFCGADLYTALASDPELPENLSPAVIAKLEGIQPAAVSQRRKRGGGPSFIRITPNMILYPVAGYCLFLASRYVERKAAPAAREYTRIPEIST